MTIIEQIKAEIERRIHNIENCPFIEAEFGASEKRDGKLIAYKDFLSFISNLESEKPMNQDELEKAVVDYFEGYWPGMETAEQCNTDLRFTPPAIMRLARHFAKWGAEHLADARKTSPKGLEEAAREYGFEEYRRRCNGGEYGTSEDAFIAGAKWVEEQLKK